MVQITSTSSLSLQGLQRAAHQAARAAQQVQAYFVNAQTQLAAAEVPQQQVAEPAPMTAGLVRPTVPYAASNGQLNDSVAGPVVSLLQAKAAYTANLKMIQSAGVLHNSLMRLIHQA